MKLLKESESLKLVLLSALDINILKKWISSDGERIKQYCNCTDPRININLANDDAGLFRLSNIKATTANFIIVLAIVFIILVKSEINCLFFL